MITVRNEFEAIPAFEHIAGSRFKTCTDRETTAQMIKVLHTTTQVDVSKYWQELAELVDDDDAGDMCEMQAEVANDLNDNALLPPYCFVTLEDNEWRVVPNLPDGESVERVDELPEKHTENELLVVSDHGNATLYVWNPNKFEYEEVWGIG